MTFTKSKYGDFPLLNLYKAVILYKDSVKLRVYPGLL